VKIFEKFNVGALRKLRGHHGAIGSALPSLRSGRSAEKLGRNHLKEAKTIKSCENL